MATDIKTRKTTKDIKALDKAAAGLGHVKNAAIQTKDATTQTKEQQTPSDYAQDKTETTAKAATGKTAHIIKKGGETLADIRTAAKKIKTRNAHETTQSHTTDTRHEPPNTLADDNTADRQNAMRQSAAKKKSQTATKEVSPTKYNTVSPHGVPSASHADTEGHTMPKSTIKTTKKNAKTIKSTDQAAIKHPDHTIKTHSQGKNRLTKAAPKTTKTAAQAQKAQKAARISAKNAQRAANKAREAAKNAQKAVKTAINAAKAVITSAKSSTLILVAGCSAVVLLLLIVLIFGAILSITGGGGEGSGNTHSDISTEVQAYEPLIRTYAQQYGIPEYTEFVKAVMMQESGGQGGDPMQSTQGIYNTRYPADAGGITDPSYSIGCGVQELRDCLISAGVETPIDIEHISLALQGYNYGNGYIEWAKTAYGGYTIANAIEFSEQKAAEMGIASYGDKQYVPHVLRYYAFTGTLAGTGRQMMVQLALTQEGNTGETYWQWYGFGERVEWCAIFVSWCADQCGYIESGQMPKFSLCSDGADWFISKGQFQSPAYTPTAGDIIFFDRNTDGTPDHVGIVETVTDNTVNTIEGNSGDVCARRSYTLDRTDIFGYGVPSY